jgi:hypothetical protein
MKKHIYFIKYGLTTGFKNWRKNIDRHSKNGRIISGFGKKLIYFGKQPKTKNRLECC